MSKELYSKLDSVIAMFNKFIEGNHSGQEREDQQVRTQWAGLKGMLEERPVKLSPIYNYFNRLDDKPAGKETNNGSLQLPRNTDKSPPPTSPPAKSPRQLTDLNKVKLLDEVKRALVLVRSNNAKLFKPQS